MKSHDEYKNVKQTVITRCKVLDDFRAEESTEDKVIKCDDEDVFDKLPTVARVVEYEDPFDTFMETMASVEQTA